MPENKMVKEKTCSSQHLEITDKKREKGKELELCDM
jgi:hypothetical protein